jgi:hypothetical protein
VTPCVGLQPLAKRLQLDAAKHEKLNVLDEKVSAAAARQPADQ